MLKSLTTILQFYEKNKLDSYETENLAKLKESLSKYRTIRTEIIAMVKEGNTQKAYNYFIDNVEPFDDAAKYLVKLN